MKKGMTPEAVEAMGRSIQEAGQHATQLYTNVHSELQDLEWTGDDQVRYLAAFEELGQQVQQLAHKAEEFQQRAQENATAQQHASA